MGENLIVLVEGKYPLSPQVKNKVVYIYTFYCLMNFFNVLNAKPQNVWSPSVGVHWRLILVKISFIELHYELNTRAG